MRRAPLRAAWAAQGAAILVTGRLLLESWVLDLGGAAAGAAFPRLPLPLSGRRQRLSSYNDVAGRPRRRRRERMFAPVWIVAALQRTQNVKAKGIGVGT